MGYGQYNDNIYKLISGTDLNVWWVLNTSSTVHVVYNFYPRFIFVSVLD